MRRAPSAALVALCLATAAPGSRADPPAAAPALRAEQITPATAEELQIGGPDAIGGVGDWYLGNDLVEVIVDDPARHFGKLDHGGTIVDAGLRDRRGEDQLAQLFPVVNLDQRVVVGYDAIRAEVDEASGVARLVVTSPGLASIPRGGALARRFDPLVPATDAIARVAVETEYRVRRGEPFVAITTVLENRGERPAPVFAWGDVWMRGGRSLRAFAVDTLDPARSRGGRHTSFDQENLLFSLDALAPFTLVAAAGLEAFPPIAYAIAAPERAAAGRRVFGVTDEHVTLANAFVGDPGWDELTLWRLAAALRSELGPGERFVFERRLVVGPRRDVAAVTDRAFPMLGFADGASGVAGEVAPAGVRCVVEIAEAASGAPLTQAAAETAGPRAGSFGALLPPGEYVLAFRAPARPTQHVGVSVRPGEVARLPRVDLGAAAGLVFEPAFADAGPGRVVVEGRDGTPDPAFDPELLGFTLDGRAATSGSETRDLFFAGFPGEVRRVELAPGRYRLTASRGLEHDAASLELELTPGEERRVPPFALARVLTLPGQVAADLHVHAEASDDSGMPNEARLRSYLAEGIDVLVATDHDNLGSYAPALAALGAAGRILVIQGVEVTSSAPLPTAPWTLGHHNAWPIALRPEAPHRGAPESQVESVAELYAALRREHGARVVQLNHPLGHDAGRDREGFLTHLGSVGEPYDPSLPLDAEPNRALLAAASDGATRAVDFDAIEVMNGADWDQYLRTREVWYSLLRQGLRRTATGNSDSHGPDEVAAYPRNYVAVAREEAFADPARLDAALRAGRSWFTTGPLLLRFTANGAAPGETASAPEGRVRVAIAVGAAPFVPVDEVRLLLDGRVVGRFPLAPDASGPVRFERELEVALRRDGFLTLEAGASLDADAARWTGERGGPYARAIAPGFLPQLVANPIWVDVDGDGAASPPPAPVAADPGAPRRLLATTVLLAALAALWWRLRARAGSR